MIDPSDPTMHKTSKVRIITFQITGAHITFSDIQSVMILLQPSSLIYTSTASVHILSTVNDLSTSHKTIKVTQLSVSTKTHPSFCISSQPLLQNHFKYVCSQFDFSHVFVLGVNTDHQSVSQIQIHIAERSQFSIPQTDDMQNYHWEVTEEEHLGTS